MLNYVEGQVTLAGRALNNKSVGSVVMQQGDVLHTGQGRAEVLLTPGVFLRVGRQSAVRMVSPDIVQTQVELLQGKAGLEVDQLFEQNDLEVMDGGVTTRLLKTGFYEFEAGHPTVLVFSGKAQVEQTAGKPITVKQHHMLLLDASTRLHPRGFNTKDAEDGLFRWSSLRSRYLAQENRSIAQEYADESGFGPGWYWDPYGLGYTYIGMDPFYSPFGWGYYNPWWGWGGGWGPGFYGGYYGGYGFRDGDGDRMGNRAPYGGYRGAAGQNHVTIPGRMGGTPGNNGFHGGFSGGGFRGGSFGGGGFHGGGGGSFHGGGGGRR